MCFHRYLLTIYDLYHYLAVDALNIIKASLININRNLSNWDGGDPYTSNWTGVTQADAQKLISRFPGSFKEASESMTQQDHKNNHAHAPQKEEGRGSNNKDSSLIGIYCRWCGWIETEIKYITPPFGKNNSSMKLIGLATRGRIRMPFGSTTICMRS